MIEFFKTIVYIPLYNVFVLLLNIPYINAAIAVILFTILIRLVLYPLSKKMIISQIRLQQIQPEIKNIQEKYKSDKQEQAKHMMALYKDKKINPLSGFVVLLIQIPIIISLYHIFASGALQQINQSLLYSFVPFPGVFDHTFFFGLIELTAPSIALALTAGISQYLVGWLQKRNLAFGPTGGGKDGERNFQKDFSKAMSIQMTYVFPVFVFIISMTLPSVLGLYWTVSNLCLFAQELVLLPHRKAARDAKTTS